MLTSVYYYNFYKPYILKSGNDRERTISPTENKTPTARSSDKMLSFVLNKSLKTEVIKYANQLSHNTNSLRNAARDVIRDVGEFYANIAHNGLDEAADWLAGDISAFVDEYNNTLDFSDKNAHSSGLMNFTETLKGSVYSNRSMLSRYGITIEDDGRLAFDSTAVANASEKRLSRANTANIPFFEDVYEMTGEFLTIPLAEHMNFKGLGYYYNYKLGTVQADTFKIIQSGLVIDMAV